MSTEMLTRPDEETFVFEDAEFEVICDIAELCSQHPGFPRCQGDPARWVAWRVNCCAEGTKYRLLCHFCKTTYQKWAAWNAAISCLHCNAITGGFVAFTELKKSS